MDVVGSSDEAHEYALDYAAAVGLTLGKVTAVSDAQARQLGPGYYNAVGPFGPGRYCGTIQQLVRRPVRGQKPKFKKVHRCFVPQFAALSLTVTYSTS